MYHYYNVHSPHTHTPAGPVFRRKRAVSFNSICLILITLIAVRHEQTLAAPCSHSRCTAASVRVLLLND